MPALCRGYLRVSSALDIMVTLQSPLFDISPPFEVLNIAASVLPKGTSKFYFAIDTDMNGVLDFDRLVSDSVVINITP